MAKPHKSTQRWTWKVRPAPVKQMRVPPVDVIQRKFERERAEALLATFDEGKFGIPIVNHRDGHYWIVDGQHRIEALRLFFAPSDPGAVDCQVFENLSDSEMAELFLSANRDRKAVPVFTNFMVSCTAEEKEATAIRRMVEANGLKIARDSEDGSIRAVSALRKVYDLAGDVVLGQTVRVLRDAGSGSSEWFDSRLIIGIGLALNRYNGKTNQHDLAKRLSATQHGAHGVLRRAEAQRDRTGNAKTQCVAAAIVDIYNKPLGPRSSERLPDWWKQAD